MYSISQEQHALITFSSKGSLQWVNTFKSDTSSYIWSNVINKPNGAVALFGIHSSTIDPNNPSSAVKYGFNRFQFDPYTGKLYDSLDLGDFPNPNMLTVDGSGKVYMFGLFVDEVTLGTSTVESTKFWTSSYLTKIQELSASLLRSNSRVIYPNPFSSSLTVIHEPNETLPLPYILYGLQGKVIQSGTLNQFEYRVDTSAPVSYTHLRAHET